MNGASSVPSLAWSTAGWTMLHFLWVGSLLAALAALGRRALRQAHPSIRYGHALVSLLLLAAAPPAIAWAIGGGSTAPAPTQRVERRPGAFLPAAVPRDVTTPSVDRSTALREVRHDPTGARNWVGTVVGVLPGVWLLGAPLTFAYLATGLWGAERLRRRSRPAADDELSALCARLAEALGVTRRVAVGVCDRVAAPLVIGVVRPLILLPPSVLSGWNPEQIELALLHELAHVRRWDNLVNLLQRVIESALFFHPAVWLLSGWVRREREHCCDRIVVQHTGRALDYAHALFLLTDSAAAPVAHASFMAENHLVDRIRRILNPEDRTMKLSRTTLGLVVALLTVPALLGVVTLRPSRRAEAQQTAPPVVSKKASDRQLRHSDMTKAMVRRRDPNAPPWQPAPAPATIPIDLVGVVRDEDGKVVVGAAITLYTITNDGSKQAAEATTGADGRYVILDATLPVTASYSEHEPLPKEITPYATFILCGRARGLGITWSPQNSMYALNDPNPDDIQGRLPLHQPVVMDLTLPKAAALAGQVVDEDGRPVSGAKVQVVSADLLDAEGHETSNGRGYDWRVLPGQAGRAVTNGRGRFRIDDLAYRACYWIQVNRPEAENTALLFYAATVDGPDMIHEPLPHSASNGRLRHEVKTGDVAVTFPKVRPVAVTVVGEGSGKPVAGARVRAGGESLQTGVVAHGTTDGAGKVLLGLPPGTYKAIFSDPPPETAYVRTEQHPFVVEPGAGTQSYELRQKAGAEVIIEAVEAGSGEPVANAFFWRAPEDRPAEEQHFRTSTFLMGREWTDEKGMMRAVFAPEPGRRYRFRFAAIREPNTRPDINPSPPKPSGYVAEPAESESVELAAGKSIRLRFVLRKGDRPSGGGPR